MILIDQHGQWPLIIHNSYVVLIMIKLELLELGRLEYYLLGFDQGTYRWTGSIPEWIYPIKLSKCFYIACQDIGGGRFSYGVEDVSGEKAKIYYASSSAIPRVMVLGIA